MLLLEHPSVYTAGRRTAADERPTDDIPVVDTDRGGKITWHGPGQLVGYPIIGLAEPLDVVNYVRRIEEALIKVCTDVGLQVGRIDGRSGVWLPAGAGVRTRKVAAIGVRVSRATTLHGFALNCDCDLDAFEAIIPCGITDAGVTSISAELGRRVGVDDVRAAVADAVCDALDGRLPVAADHVSGSSARRCGAHRRRRPAHRRPRSIVFVTVAPEGRKLLRLEVRNAETPIERKPPWIKTRLRMGPEYTELKKLVRREGLHTVCEEAGCPNIYECWEDREATFLIGGEVCSSPLRLLPDRHRQARAAGPRRTAAGRRKRAGDEPAILHRHRGGPRRPARRWCLAVRRNRARHQATQPVDRGGVADPRLQRRRRSVAGGLRSHDQKCWRTTSKPFRASSSASVRPSPTERSLGVLTAARDFGLVTKSNLILGMGETPDEIRAALVDLREAGCDIVTITQYLRPTVRHHPVDRWVDPEEFVEHADYAEQLGFAGVLAGPLVRSSYRAGRLYQQANQRRHQTPTAQPR